MLEDLHPRDAGGTPAVWNLNTIDAEPITVTYHHVQPISAIDYQLLIASVHSAACHILIIIRPFTKGLDIHSTRHGMSLILSIARVDH
jgi:hypothetical protein